MSSSREIRSRDTLPKSTPHRSADKPSSTEEDPDHPAHTPDGPHWNAASAPSVQLSMGVVFAVAAVLVVGTLALGMPIELAMLFAFVLLVLVVYTRGFSFAEAQDAAFDSIRSILELVFILFSVGMLVSTWAMAGTIPLIIVAGLELITPSLFYVTAILLCSATSLVTGTSWGTMGSVGIALMAVGQGLGMPAALTAGAVISGAYFGDKLSMLSDSTNLSAAITGTPLLTHIKYMLYTTTPAYVLTLVIFGVIGFVMPHGEAETGAVDEIVSALQSNFDMGWYVLIPAVVTVAMLVFRLPPALAIIFGAVAAGIIALLFQGATVSAVVAAFYDGFELDTGTPSIDDLVSGGGLLSMAGLAMLFIFAVGVSGLLNKGGFVQALLDVFMRWATTRRRLMVLTTPIMLLAQALGASFSFAAVMAGTVLSPAYRQKRLRSENLSRTIEDSGTVYDAFFPWGGGGVFAAGALGVATLEYMPFMFFAFLSTIFSIIIALTQFRVRTLAPEDGDGHEGRERAEDHTSVPAS